MDTTKESSIISISIAELSIGDLRAEYYSIRNTLTNVQSELEQKNQELYDCKRLLKTAEALEKDYQQEIETLQNNESEEQSKLKSTVQKLKTDLTDLKQFSTEQIQYLESELSVKNDELKELQDELKSLAEGISKQSTNDTDILKEENQKLKIEIEMLTEKYDELNEEAQGLKHQNTLLEEQMVALKAEVEGLNENLKCKREELAEANDIINTLQGEMAILRNEMDALQSKPLDKDSKGNSLFAEVDDKRVELQRTAQNLKTKYAEMKREYTNLMKQVSSLRAENVKLREAWESDLSNLASDKQSLSRSYKSHIETLQNIIKSYENEAAERRKNNNYDYTSDYRFLDKLITKKGMEIEALRQELSAESLKITVLCEDLCRANTELRQLRLEKIELKQELANLKNDSQLKAVQVDKDVPFTKENAEPPIERYSQNVDFSRLERKMKSSLNMTGIIKSIFDTENKENLEVNNEDTAAVEKVENDTVQVQDDAEQPSRKVTFFNDTPVEKSVAQNAPVRKRGKIIKCTPIPISSLKKK